MQLVLKISADLSAVKLPMSIKLTVRYGAFIYHSSAAVTTRTPTTVISSRVF